MYVQIQFSLDQYRMSEYQVKYCVVPKNWQDYLKVWGKVLFFFFYSQERNYKVSAPILFFFPQDI